MIESIDSTGGRESLKKILIAASAAAEIGFVTQDPSSAASASNCKITLVRRRSGGREAAFFSRPTLGSRRIEAQLVRAHTGRDCS